MSIIELCERGWIPDSLTRYGIRKLCKQRLVEESQSQLNAADQRFRKLLNALRALRSAYRFLQTLLRQTLEVFKLLLRDR
jgi:hypothetical protein